MSRDICKRWSSLTFACIALFTANIGVARADWARIRIYESEKYKGSEAVYIGPRKVFATVPFAAQSVRVLSGRWLLCDTVGLSGNCAWLAGDVESLNEIGLTSPVVSLRSDVVPLIRREWGDRHPPPRTSLVFFPEKDYKGDWVRIAGDTPDLASLPNAIEPRSVVVQDGVWRLCTEPGLKGRCLTMTGSSWDIADIFTSQIRSVERLK